MFNGLTPVFYFSELTLLIVVSVFSEVRDAL